MRKAEVIKELIDWMKKQFGDGAELLLYPRLNIRDGIDKELEIVSDFPRKYVRDGKERFAILVTDGSTTYRLDLSGLKVIQCITSMLMKYDSLRGRKIRIKSGLSEDGRFIVNVEELPWVSGGGEEGGEE